MSEEKKSRRYTWLNADGGEAPMHAEAGSPSPAKLTEDDFVKTLDALMPQAGPLTIFRRQVAEPAQYNYTQVIKTPPGLIGRLASGLPNIIMPAGSPLPTLSARMQASGRSDRIDPAAHFRTLVLRASAANLREVEGLSADVDVARHALADLRGIMQGDDRDLKPVEALRAALDSIVERGHSLPAAFYESGLQSAREAALLKENEELKAELEATRRHRDRLLPVARAQNAAELRRQRHRLKYGR